MRYSGLTQRIAGEGAAAWQIHNRALQLREQGVDILLLVGRRPGFRYTQTHRPGRYRQLAGG